jgi:beta-glucosidase-like glycosyl hydrolase
LRSGMDNGAACFDNGADILIGFEDPGGAIRELTLAVSDGVITGERIDTAIARIEAVKSGMAPQRKIEVNQALGEFLSREISRMAVTLVKGNGRFFPLRESDKIPLVYAGDEEYFQNSPLRFYVNQASHISRPLSSKERPAMFLLFGDAAAEGLPTDSEAHEMEALSRLIRATSPSVVVSFGSPHALTRFKDADVLIAAYDSSSHAQEAVFKCVTGEGEFQGRLPVRLDIPDKKGRRK